MIHLQNQEIENSEIVLEGKEYQYLGPNLVLKNCRIVIRLSARSLTITEVKFVGCQIDAKRKLINCQEWCRNSIRQCTFTGTYSGNDFGHWDSPLGELQDCDFSKAILDRCRMMDCDVKSIRFPRWPCFTVLQPGSALVGTGPIK